MRSRSRSRQRSATEAGLVVVHRLSGSVAEAVGLERGDVILSVNGVPTPDLQSYIRARRLSGGGARLLIQRGEGSFVLEIALPALERPRPVSWQSHAAQSSLS